MLLSAGLISLLLPEPSARLLFTARDDAPPKRTEAEVRREALECAWMLHQFKFAQKAWFPDGVDKADRVDLTGDGVMWPPPKTYSWRVAILPATEQTPLYTKIAVESNGFKIPGNLSVAELEEQPDLKKAFEAMPAWFAINTIEAKPDQTIYRRVVVPDKAKVFIVVESVNLTTWYKAGDDLVLDAKKPIPEMGGNFLNGFFALCGDGKARFLPNTLSESKLRAALISGEGVPALNMESKKTLEDDLKKLILTVNK